MSETQTEAYLLARETLRRIRHAAALPAGPVRAEPELGAGPEAPPLRERRHP